MKKTKTLTPLLLGIIFLFLTSCCSENRAAPLPLPTSSLETAIAEASKDSLIDVTSSLPGNWWCLFNDAQLDEFIQKALQRNPTLQMAEANIRYASANALKARAVLFPSLNWGADVSRQKFSETGIIPFNSSPLTGTTAALTPLAVTGGVNAIPVYFTQYETEAILNYDFDIWGKNRNTWRAAIGEMRSKIADEAFKRLQLAISVSKVYYQLQIDYKRLAIAQAIVKNRSEYLRLSEQRLNNNLENILIVHTAENNLVSAKQSLLQIEIDIAVNEHQLKAYLADNFEEEISNILIEESCLPNVPVPFDIPLHLIAYRPDIIAQLWLIESAGKQIEVAKAGFYPDFNLAAIFGYQTIHLHELFKWPSTFFNVDPAVSLPIFDGGRLQANLYGSEVNYDLAIYQYNQLILDAVKEVLDGIAILRNSEKQQKEFKQQVEYQEELYKLTNLRVNYHLNSGLDALDYEENVLVSRDKEIIALGNTIQAMLSLIKALGGGYKPCLQIGKNENA